MKVFIWCPECKTWHKTEYRKHLDFKEFDRPLDRENWTDVCGHIVLLEEEKQEEGE